MGQKADDRGVVYRFGPFRLLPNECLLLREAEPVRLTPRAFDLLRLLVESAGHLKSRDELVEALWPTTVVGERSLAWNVSAVRKALGDDRAAPRYIETVPRRGYRFIAPVETIEGAGDVEERGRSVPDRRWRRAAVGGVIAAAVAGFVLFLARPRIFAGSQATATAPRRPSVAVLPFENLSADKGNAYFAAGIQDLILTKLADIGELKVISRTSTAGYTSHPGDLKDIARQLGVTTILEGSVQKTGDKVLVNVQLVDARTGDHLWARSYERTLDKLFSVEGDVAQRVATALKAKLSAGEAQRLATELSGDPAANDLFLRAEYLVNRGFFTDNSLDALRQAISTYKAALARAPGFALAWARRSYCESALAWVGAKDVKALEAQARADAGRALELAPDLAAARLALGYSDYYGRGDYAAARKVFSAALALRPGDADALAARGSIDRRLGRFEAAIASYRQAFRLDPRNSHRAWALGQSYMAISRYADAERAFHRALALDPGNTLAKIYLARTILSSSGNIQRALDTVRGTAPILKLKRVDFLTYERKYHKALALLDSVPDTGYNFRPYRLPKALLQGDLYYYMGDMSRARPLLRRALAESRAQLKREYGLNLASVWQNVADADIHLGRTAQGLHAVARAWAVFARTGDRYVRSGYMLGDAGLYSDAGRADLAVPLLTHAFAMPGSIHVYYSPRMLWIDPLWDPIRHDPRFQALLRKYAGYKPANAATTTLAAAGAHE